MVLQIPSHVAAWCLEYRKTLHRCLISRSWAYQKLSGFGPQSRRGFNTAYVTFWCLTYLLVTGLHRNVLCFLLGYSNFQLKALALAAWSSLTQSVVFGFFFYQLENFFQKNRWSICLELNYWERGTTVCSSCCMLVIVRNEVNGDKIYPTKKVICS